MKRLHNGAYGLIILESLYKKNKHNSVIQIALTNAYIKKNNFEKAISIIEPKVVNRTDLKSLELMSWAASIKKDLNKQKEIWEIIIKKSYFPAVNHSKNELIKMSSSKINIGKNDIVLFTHIYNEMHRLPSFINHYRALGVNKFIVIDNNSTDLSREWLLCQKDCYVFWTNNCHLESSSGMSWIKVLKDEFLPINSWYLVVDADEYLIYPNYENKKLGEIITYMDKYGFDALPSFMLDMYPKDIRKNTSDNANVDPFKTSPFFYNNYRFEGHTRPPYYDVHGGIFFALEQQRIKLVKVPLVKNIKGLSFIMGNHNTSPANFSDITSCVLHFKFIGNLKESSLVMMKEKRHWEGSIKYKSYNNIFNSSEKNVVDLSTLDKSTKFINSRQLVALDLIKNPRNF